MENQITIDILNELLANQHVLYIKTRNAHWNITGKDFFNIHKFFEDIYKKIEEDIDNTAERIRKLDSIVIANLQFFNELSILQSNECQFTDSVSLIKFIYDDLFLLNNLIKNEYLKNIKEDLTTINFLTNLAEENEKTLWFLKSHLT